MLAFAAGSAAASDGIPGVETSAAKPASVAEIEASAAKFANAKPIQHQRGYAGDLAAARLQAPAPGPQPDHVTLSLPPVEESEKTPALAPPLGTNFDGISDTGSIPADPALAVGGSKIIQVVNSSIRITDRAGGAVQTSTLLAMMGNPSGGSGSLFDPRVQYDHHNSRFIVLALVTNSGRTDSWYIVSVSKNTTPTTAPSSWFTYYFRSDFDGATDTAFWADYAPLAFDNTYIYITSNQFNSSGTFQYSKIRRYPKSYMFAGASVSGVEWNDVRDTANNRVFTIQPAVTFGAPGSEWLAAVPFGTGSTLAVFRITGNSLFRYSVAVGSTSVPNQARQKNSTSLIHTGDNRLLNAVFSNNRLYVAHTVKSGTFNCAGRILGIIASTTSAPTRNLDRVIGSTAFDLYYPAVSCNPASYTTSRLAIAASFSAPDRFAGICYSQMTPTGGLQTLGILKEGQNTYFKTYSGTRNRWGDYNGICRDPLDTNRFWFNAMYARSTVNTWGTYVGSTVVNTAAIPGVNATFDADSSQLVISGDDFSNRVQVTRGSGGVQVKGLRGTLVNGRSSVTFTAPEVISLNVNLGGGSDELNLVGLHLSTLDAELGLGNDRMSASLCLIDQLRANGGDGTDVVTTTSSIVNQSTVESVP